MHFLRNPIVLTIFNGIVSLLGDELVKWNANNANTLLLKAICDNLTHALNGFLCALIILLRTDLQLAWNERISLLLAGSLVASGIDLDHFIVARSTVLERAVSIGVRPHLHCTTIPLILISLIIPIDKTFASHRINLCVLIVIGSFLVHHVRDANRRGLWIYPFGSTAALPTMIYVLLIMLIPLLLSQLQDLTISGKVTKQRSSLGILSV